MRFALCLQISDSQILLAILVARAAAAQHARQPRETWYLELGRRRIVDASNLDPRLAAAPFFFRDTVEHPGHMATTAAPRLLC